MSRSLHARVIDRLHAAGAREIVYDVQFTEPTVPAQDNALINAVGRAPGKVVLATTEAHKVPATIVDRCHRFDFHRPSLDQIAAHEWPRYTPQDGKR